MESPKENLSEAELESLIHLILEKIPLIKGLEDQTKADGVNKASTQVLDEYKAEEEKSLRLLIELLIKYRGQAVEIVKFLQEMGIDIEIPKE